MGLQRDEATLHTLGLLVPILNFFIIFWLWRDLNALRERFGLSEFPAVAYLVGSTFIAPVSSASWSTGSTSTGMCVPTGSRPTRA